MPQKTIKLPQIKGKSNKASGHVDSNPAFLKRPIDLLFGSGARVDVLWCLMKFPFLEQRELMRLTGKSFKDVKRALTILLKLGLAEEMHAGSGSFPSESMHLLWDDKFLKDNLRTLYRLNEKNPWTHSLKMLFECAIGGIDLINETISGVAGIDVAFVFGSYATSEQNSESDIDLMVIGNYDQRLLGDKIISLEKRIRREIQLITYTPDEWHKAFQDRSHFVVSLMEAPKIYLMGDARELQKVTLGSEE
ncbi:MAG: nucleotidyltransferase domain-containing protein [bacterium]|nr:nucleotidyltransferase domain-containing protein [bacterium]